MKPTLIFAFLLFFLNSYSQQEEFLIQGKIIDKNGTAISDAYIINLRNLDKNTSRGNGVFDTYVLPNDSLVITHVSFLRKTVTAYSLMKNPVVQLNPDTVNIQQINVLSDQMTDMERAKKNIENMGFSMKPKPGGDSYTESERMNDLMSTENRIQRSEASAVIYQFSPSAIIGGLVDKIEKRKKSNEYYSTRKKKDNE